MLKRNDTRYYVLVEEWLVPSHSGREVLANTYDDLEKARDAAMAHLRLAKQDFENATKLKATNPAEYGELMCIMTPGEGQEDEWYDCVKILPISWGCPPDLCNPIKKEEIKETKTVICDLRLFAIGDQWGAVAELEDGSEVPVWAVNGNEGFPPWENDEKEYEDWYNRALEEAHRQGLYLEGELSEKYDNINEKG
jgi:hypothetical protein